MPGRQKSLTGTVVGDQMDKTVVVAVETTARHRLYHKIIRRTKRYLAHDDRLEAKQGDLVRIVETRPLSRHKRWRVVEILERGEAAEVAPREIDAEYLSRHRETEAPPVPVAAERPSAEEESAAAVEEPAAETTQAEPPAEAAPAEEAPAEVEEAEEEGQAEPEAKAQATVEEEATIEEPEAPPDEDEEP